jgi:hypothetical protein
MLCWYILYSANFVVEEGGKLHHSPYSFIAKYVLIIISTSIFRSIINHLKGWNSSNIWEQP